MKIKSKVPQTTNNKKGEVKKKLVSVPDTIVIGEQKYKMSQEGNETVVEPIGEGFSDMEESLAMFSNDFMQEGRNQQTKQRDEVFE